MSEISSPRASSPKPSSSESPTKGEVSKEKVSRLVKKLRSPCGKDAYKALTYIKSYVIESDEGMKFLLELEAFKYIIRLLTANKVDILNIVLSVLGNSSCKPNMNQDLGEEMLKHDIANRVVALLRKTSSLSVQMRVCRLIGNLAQILSIGKELHRANVIIAIVPVLNSTKEVEVQMMCVRALRWLWEVEKYHNDMLKAGAVKAVANILTTENEGLLKQTLRALISFTQPVLNATAQQICCDNGEGYKLLVSKMPMHLVSVLVSNLSHSPFARVELSKAGIIPQIIKRLENNIIDSYLITALCHMCRESMIRASLRNTPNGFQTLLSLLSNPKAKRFFPEIINAITHFNYDQPSLMMMVRVGLINVLVEKLSEYVKVHLDVHMEAQGETFVSPVHSPSMMSPEWCKSPSPTATSPGCSLLYSPRCTTPESDADASESSYDFPKSYMERFPEGPMGEDGCILEVLSQLTYQATPMTALASKQTIHTFLNYIAALKYPQNRPNYMKATKTFSAIVMCKYYYNILLEDESILAIHRCLCRPTHADCFHCRRLDETGRSVLTDISMAAQSGLGEGEMTYRLATAAGNIKTTVSLTIPHVIKQPNLLYKLLFTHSAFRHLVESLDSRIEEAVPSLNSLFITLNITNPQVLVQICTQCDVSSVRREGNITFTLDDGSTVTANKETLANKCPVFEAMFRGGFKESLQSDIRLTDITADCMTHFSRLASADEYCTCVLPRNLATLLEMVTITDRFLLPELTVKILSVLMNYSLTHSTCDQIYDWGLHTGYKLPASSHVATDTVKFLLSSEMLSLHRTAAVKRIMESENKAQFITHLTDIVSEGLKKYTKMYRYINYKPH